MESAAGLSQCPRSDSLPSDGTGSLFFEMRSELAVGVAAVRDAIFLFGRHFGECLFGSARLEPGIPCELLRAASLHEDFAEAFALEDVPFYSVPVGNAAL